MQIDTVDKSVVQAYVAGKQFTDFPKDLFIPPDALEILLDSFTGPLDLLLYLIKKQNIDILDIPIVSITRQYLQNIYLMENQRMELAAEYLVMAAMLAEIKSRMLLPLTSFEEEEEDVDPRAELIRRLQAYEQIKIAVECIEQLPRQDRDVFLIELQSDNPEVINPEPELNLVDLLTAYEQLLIREGHQQDHHISRENYSIKERMSKILLALQKEKFVKFSDLYSFEEGRAGLVVSFLAILELARQSLLTLTQAQPYTAIYLTATGNG